MLFFMASHTCPLDSLFLYFGNTAPWTHSFTFLPWRHGCYSLWYSHWPFGHIFSILALIRRCPLWPHGCYSLWLLTLALWTHSFSILAIRPLGLTLSPFCRGIRMLFIMLLHWPFRHIFSAAHCGPMDVIAYGLSHLPFGLSLSLFWQYGPLGSLFHLLPWRHGCYSLWYSHWPFGHIFSFLSPIRHCPLWPHGYYPSWLLTLSVWTHSFSILAIRPLELTLS